MALLLKGRTTPSAASSHEPGEAPVQVPDFACHACGAGMKAGQDWCLECGMAAPGRLGTRSSWRAAVSVVSVTLLLVGGAVTASYAALTSDAERAASAPSAGSGEPIPATAPPGIAAAPITPGATGPGVTPPAGGAPSTGQPPAGTPIIPVKPPAPATNTPVKPPAATTKPKASDEPPAASKAPATSGEAANEPKPEIVKFKKDAATTYDPSEREGAEFGPPKNAIDTSKKTVWDVTVPADDRPIGAGLLLDLGKPYDLRALTIDTPTEGYTVEIYGAASAKEVPADILDKRWEHITDIRGVKDGDLVKLQGKSERKQQLLLLYVTIPTNAKDPRAAIGNVTVAGTP